MLKVLVSTRAFAGVVEPGRTIDVVAPGHDRHDSTAELTPGQSTIEVHEDQVRLSSDLTGTSPLLWHSDGSQLVVADSPGLLQRAGVDLLPDPIGIKQFRAAGYTLGERTLLDDVQHVQAGHHVAIELADGACSDIAPTFQRPEAERFTTSDEADVALVSALDRVFSDALQRNSGRRLVVPLSGGLDSRLLVAWLRRLGCDDVLTFSYGRSGSSELRTSQHIAEDFGYEWTSVSLVPEEVTRAWSGPDAARFIEFAWGATSLPHVQDWFALQRLLAERKIEPGDVVLPGHTVIGNLHNESVLHAASMDREVLVKSLTQAHLNLDGRWKKAFRDPDLGGFVRSFVASTLEGDSPQHWADAQELFNVTERQSKYIDNSMKAYEALGLGWELPMLDAPMWSFAGRLPLELSEGRNWYRTFVERTLLSMCSDAVPLHRDQRLDATTTAAVGRALARVHLKSPAEHLLACRHTLHHPLGLDLYAAALPRWELTARLLAGQTIMGIYASLFLDGRWNPLVDLHTTPTLGARSSATGI